MRILLITFNFPPQVGGVAEVVRTQAAGFTSRGHEVSVATTFDPQRKPEHALRGVSIHQFDVAGGYEVGHGYCGEITRYLEFLAQSPADIMLFHCWQSWSTDLAAAALRRSSARTVMLSHGLDAQVWKPRRKFPWGLGAWIRSVPYVARVPALMRAFDRLVFLSRRCDAGRFFDVWLARRFCPDRISYIPNGVHLTEFGRPHGDFRAAHGIHTKFMVLTVANYDDRKNQLATVRDFMTANREDATLVLIGGSFNAYQARVAAEHERLRHHFPKAQVRFLEKIPKSAIYAAYQAADLFVLSAKYETQPLAILDAMAAGVPFLSTNVGCVSEFPGGWVRASGSATVAALTRLLDDGVLRTTLGKQGQEACRTTYDWERVLDAYEELFAELKSKPR